jgi:hypothetical protein
MVTQFWIITLVEKRGFKKIPFLLIGEVIIESACYGGMRTRQSIQNIQNAFILMTEVLKWT